MFRQKIAPGVTLLLLLAGCSADALGVRATVAFRRDANSCQGGPLVFDFFADGSALGTDTLRVGEEQAFGISPGGHLFSARTTDRSLNFPTKSATIDAGQRYTFLMTCF